MNDFLNTVKGLIGKVPFTTDAVALYFCLLDPRTPLPVKATIGAALTYFISPIDAIPDALAVIGFTDDASVIAMTLSTLGGAVTADHKQQANQFFNPELG
jgi:uncharacterized membrane protein YkvA (DUF1232 family)